MPVLLVVLMLLAALGFGLVWLNRANPTTVARRLRLGLVVLGAVGVAGLLILGLDFLPTLLPELFGLGGVVVTGLIARALRSRPSGGFSTPGASQRTETRAAFLDAWIDHGTGDVGGRVTRGRFTGQLLDTLSEGDLQAFHSECAADPDSLRILEAYLDWRLGPQWRARKTPPPAAPGGGMGRTEALAVLGLTEEATPDDIRAAHRRLIQRVHPDVGGSADLAARINQAKDILLGV